MKERWVQVPEGMKGPLIASAIVHIGLVIVAITGLPYFKSEQKPLVSAIPVEILPIGEMTTSNRPKPVEAPPAPEPEKLERPPEKKPVPPKVEEVKPPEPPKPAKAEKPKLKAKPVTPPPPDEAALEKAEEPPKPEEKKPPEPAEAKEEAPQDQTQDFSKLLKNLQESTPQATDESLPENKNAAPVSPAPMAPFAETMTMSEADALALQLQRCWSIQAGARYAEDLIVKVRLTVSPERRVLSAVIVDTWRYSQDSYFRAAADAAIRAVHSPQCEVLNLPPNKYDIWKDIVVTFDPTEML